ncbi:MAG: membrane protein insertase YidC [Pseudoxanthomonas sp.]
MNQTRVFLLFAWMMVAVLLWMQWDKWKVQQNAPVAPVAAAPAAATVETTGTVPDTRGLLPAAAGAAAPAPAATTTIAAAVHTLTLTTDVLELRIDGSRITGAQLLQYPQSKAAGSPPVVMFNDDPAGFYQAQVAWTNTAGTAPGPGAVFEPVAGQADALTLAQGQDTLSASFVWNGAYGISVRRTFTVHRGQYVIEVSDEVHNDGGAPWQGVVYRQLERTAPQPHKGGMMNPQSYSLTGATWYGPGLGYHRHAFKDYLGDGKLDQEVTGGWLAMVEHHFLSAWLPPAKDSVRFSLDQRSAGGDTRYLATVAGPGMSVPAGGVQTTSARLWVGPKLVAGIHATGVDNFDRAVDYSRFSLMAIIGRGLFWVLSHLHTLLGNWGWSIVGLVVMLRVALYPLSAAQYKSAAKTRKFQPRLAQLKERYGEDRAKYQQAMMELYKKEKINPVGGCLPLLIQMPIFFALYQVLSESVELRQAPWMLWIGDLTAPDPYFILPILNVAVMWLTQKLTPTTGMDPAQAKMMQFMPLVFGVMTAFMPSGLVLYWVMSGGLALLIQWWMIRTHGEKPSQIIHDNVVK